MDQSICPNNSTEKYPKSTSTRNFEAIKSILLPQRESDVTVKIFESMILMNFDVFEVLESE